MKRTLALVSAALVAAVAAPTSAAPRALCFQVKDAAGDARPGGDLTPAAVQTDSLDVLSADIATGAKNLVATIRLKTLSPEPYLLGGATYIFYFTVGGAEHDLYFKRTTSGAEVAAYKPPGAVGGGTSVKVAKDPAAATITWTVPRKQVVGLKQGASITGLKVTAFLGTNFNDAGSGRGGTGFDTATSTKAYKDGTKTCLKGT